MSLPLKCSSHSHIYVAVLLGRIFLKADHQRLGSVPFAQLKSRSTARHKEDTNKMQRKIADTAFMFHIKPLCALPIMGGKKNLQIKE